MVEAIVAIAIIMTAVSSTLTLVQSTINASKNSEALLVAGNLAREGIEVVREIRDSNWLAGRAFDEGLYAAGNDYRGVPVFNPTTGAWSIDFAATTIGAGNTTVYRYSTGTNLGLMVQAIPQPASTVATVYHRNLNIDPLCDNGAGSYTIVTSGSDCGVNAKIGVRVLSTVAWNVGDKQKQLYLEERMFNWR